MREPKFLFVVTDTFAIEGRGLILAPEVDLGSRAHRIILVELRRSDGTAFQSSALAQIPFISPPDRVHRHVILLPAGVEKAAVPIGSEVWLLGPA